MVEQRGVAGRRVARNAGCGPPITEPFCAIVVSESEIVIAETSQKAEEEAGVGPFEDARLSEAPGSVGFTPARGGAHGAQTK